MAKDFLLSPELAEFQGTFAQLMTEAFDSRQLRSRMLVGESGERIQPQPLDTNLWERVIATGALMAVTPEAQGGLGFGCQAAQMLVLESGYNLATVPLFETLALAVRPLLVADSETSLNLAGRIVEEGLPATGAFQSFFEKEELPLASLVGSRFQVSGVLKYIPSLEQCEVLIFPARVTGSGSAAKVALFSVTTAAVRPFAKTTPTLDLIRSYSQISLKNLDASLVAEISQDKQEKISQELLILAAAEMIGAAGRTLSTTLDYVKTRKQFSRPIGSFQAIGHQLSDMAVAVEASSALNRFAAWAADCDPSQLASTALACKAHASECMPRVVESALQLHGGIGFTFEYDLHLFLRRVRALALSFGRAQGLQAQLGEAALV